MMQPTANLSGPSTAIVGQSISVVPLGTAGQGAHIASAILTWGDEQSQSWDGNGVSLSHAYMSPATVQVVLTVTDSKKRVATASLSITVADAIPPPTGTIQQSNVLHQGSFFVPPGFEYDGRALAFNPLRNSLLLGFGTYAAEISIPALDARATVLQSAIDLSEGINTGASDERLGGMLVHNGELWFTRWIYYDDGDIQRLSHFRRPLDFSVTGQVQGPYQVGPLHAGFYSGYMCPVPANLQADLGGPVLTGNCDLNIINRTSFGPAAFSLDLLSAIVNQDAQALVYYPSDHPALGEYNPCWPSTGPCPVTSAFGGSDSMAGIVVIDGYRSVLFFGRHGTTFCYGGAACNDPTKPQEQGVHGYPYLQQVWAYAVDDLVAVKNGTKQPYEVMPYAVWTLDDIGSQHELCGCAFDPATRTLYVGERRGENDTSPKIHVYQVQ